MQNGQEFGFYAISELWCLNVKPIKITVFNGHKYIMHSGKYSYSNVLKCYGNAVDKCEHLSSNYRIITFRK